MLKNTESSTSETLCDLRPTAAEHFLDEDVPVADSGIR